MLRCVFFIALLYCGSLFSQSNFTHQDSLRGTITPERAWWDVQHYNSEIDVNIDSQSISGTNTITFLVLERDSIMQVDLQEPMMITEVLFNGKKLHFTSDGIAHYIHFERPLQTGNTERVTINYKGTPTVPQRPPWDGGWTWTKDDQGRPFIATANQGAGASMWWPCKDHPYDEASGVDLLITVPSELTAVGNGRLIQRTETLNKATYHWQVRSPINNYGVNVNIAHYAHFSEKYPGLEGQLDCSYYVLDYNLEKAKTQFEEAPRMLSAFEHWFGPYPFYRDGYKLVEVPYLGMEHQSSVTYGNKYQNGYLGRDLSQTGHGLLFDFIIIHESAHEWWANSITAADNADMWIHESFTHYAESIFLEHHFGKDTAFEYIRGVRSRIKNDRPIQGPFGVNRSGSGDMYYKGANIWHMLRTLVDDDEKWRNLLIGIQTHFKHQTLNAEELRRFIEDVLDFSLKPFFQQWFQSEQIPILEYRIFPGGFEYRWGPSVENFNMPIDVIVHGKKQRLFPTKKWNRSFQTPVESLVISPDFYVGSMRLN